jgi:hypothetical protein
MKYLLALLLSYSAVAAFTTALWVVHARTEKHPYCSIVAVADGTAPAPFVKRRLLPDCARGLAAAVPEAAWDWLRRSLPGDGPASGLLRRAVEYLRWRPADYPVLFSAYFLIGCSALGLQFTCRWLVRLLYDCPGWLADLLGGLFGLALLGGCSEAYNSYSYDFPTCFLFTLTLTAMLARRWWFVLTFLATAYAKETAVLLIVAYALTARDRRSARFACTAGLLLALYLGVRLAIDRAYPSPPDKFWGGFWYPGRNLKHLLQNLVYYSWLLPALGFVAVRVLRRWRSYPPELRRLSFLAVPLLGLAFFMGWVEEKRQYLEVLAVFGLIGTQWLLIEAGLGRLLRPRSLLVEDGPPGWEEPPSADVAPRGARRPLRRGPLPQEVPALGPVFSPEWDFPAPSPR